MLLLSAVNTAIAALIGLFYMMARDGEMPRSFTRLNSFGVPWVPLGIAVLLPVAVTAVAENLESLAGLYAIGVVGAIAVNLGSCTFNRRLPVRWYQRGIMGVTFLILSAVELTIAKTRQDALFFACLTVTFGLMLRSWAQRRAGLRTLTVPAQVAAAIAPETHPEFRLNLNPDQTVLVAARGMTPVLRFALEECHLRKASLYVLYVKELAVSLPGVPTQQEMPRWQADKEAAAIMYPMLALGRQHEVTVIPLYTVSEQPAATILDLTATLGVDLLILGAPHRRTLVRLLKGDVVTQVANNLPESIQLLIYG
jgi:nucleotide-binding universal stress UspA family protein